MDGNIPGGSFPKVRGVGGGVGERGFQGRVWWVGIFLGGNFLRIFQISLEQSSRVAIQKIS